jgi:HAD superfamily hydrolase (TIGR01450 family)
LRAFFFDLDGCVYHGSRLDPDARTFIDRLRADGKKVGFITNNSRELPAEIAAKLARMGLHADADEVVTATEAAAAWVAQRHGLSRVQIAGSDSLARAFMQAGHRVIELGEDSVLPDCIVIGRDTEFSYAKLAHIVRGGQRGVPIVLANPDTFHPGAGGEYVPETGALGATVEAILGCKLEYVGKPAAFMFEYGMARKQERPAACAMVGDNPHTDVAGALGAGMTAVWLRGEHAGPWLDNSDDALTQTAITVRSMRELLELYGATV